MNADNFPFLHQIVIVGGGAGGLELATRLGDTLGKKRRAQITLIDKTSTHLWKPLLHEVAAGSMDLDTHSLEYLAQAYWHHFRFRLGSMDGLDRAARQVYVAPTFDEQGNELIPRHEVAYDTLIICVGSTTNDYGTPGAAEHAIALDTAEEAERFRQRLINACIRANAQAGPLRPGQLHVAIVGGGATGLELAAQLHNTTRQLVVYGLDEIDPEKDIKLHIIEAAERILAALPKRLSDAVEEQLKRLGVQIYTGERVTEVMADAVRTQNGKTIAAELVVWAAGIKAPDFLRGLDGLETNSMNQLIVRPTLQTTLDENIFAFGDCASCPWPGKNTSVPPRAQAAHQQASFLVKA
ncbi:MAG: NAD(P)/FAD-dependent oxidoreductase, partial [Burkholderiales bacterium]